MTETQLEKGTLLGEIIKETKEGLVGLKKIQRGIGTDKRSKDNEYDDGLYTLSIFEHGDSSGNGASFSRYMGNASLLRTIIAHTEDQLIMYEQAFKEI